MNANQETFLREYLRTGDKRKAYQAAYPNAKESSLKNAANRLLQNNPEIIAAVAAKTAAWQQEAEEEGEARVKFNYLTQLRAKQLLTLTAEGLLETNKVWHTRDGFATHPVTPSHAQILSAIHKYAMMEGWYAKGRGAGEKKEEEKPEEPTSYEFFMNKLPFDEYGRIYGNTIEAYFDPDGPTWRCQPDNNHMAHHFLPLQKKREERRDQERQARMTPQLKLEEEQSLREFENRRADDDGYVHHEKLIEQLINDYSEAPEPEKLETLTAIQNMCGLRFLHHRHRYEAEKIAGWQFHPFNHALIKPACHSEPREESARPQQPLTSADQANQNNQSNLRFRQENQPPNRQLSEAVSSIPIKNQPPNRQQTTTTERSELMSMPLKNNDAMRITSPTSPFEGGKACETATQMQSQGDVHSRKEIAQPQPPPEKPTHQQLLQQGYQTLSELLQDEFDYYIKNQGSTTYKQKKDLEKFAAHRNAPPETKQQIEQETGWLYHPTELSYAKRHPNRPLVRTRFRGIV